MPDQVAGRYQLGETLGAGGAGTVRKGWDPRLSRQVAVKLLRPGVADEHGQRARLFAEARAAGGLHHPGIASIYDVGEEKGTAYLVMQYVEGESLADLLKRGPLDEATVRRLLVGICEALTAAHAAGVVHRDLKPGNVMIRPDGSTVLVDFGIARTESSEPLTLTGTVIGTADYLSPEQARGEVATAQSDLYSLGVVAFECLTGEKPFHRDTLVATALAQVRDPLPALPASVSPGLAALIGRMCAKNPADRPRDAAAVLTGLTEPEVAAPDAARGGAATTVLPATAVLAAPAGAAGSPVAAPVEPPAAGAGPAPWPTSRLRWQHAAIAIGALLLLIVLVVLFSMRKDNPPPTSPTGPTHSPTSTSAATSTSTGSSPSKSPSTTAPTTSAPPVTTGKTTKPGGGHGKGKGHSKK